MSVKYAQPTAFGWREAYIHHLAKELLTVASLWDCQVTVMSHRKPGIVGPIIECKSIKLAKEIE